MKPGQIFELVLTVAAVTLTTTKSAPISSEDSIVKQNGGKLLIRRQKVIGTCLRIAPDLPPCNFDAEATWRSKNGDILHGDPAGSGYPPGKMPEVFADGSEGEKILTGDRVGRKDGTSISPAEKNLGEFELFENDLSLTVVYYLEGCLPSRLPFDLPSCSIDELQTIQMNKLFPFKLPGIEDALIFPEIDVKQIEFSHRQSRDPPASRSYEEKLTGFDASSKLYDRFSTLTPVNFGEVGKFAKGIHDFHKMIAKSNTKPRTGAANTKYATMRQGSGSTSMSSVISPTSEKSEVITPEDRTRVQLGINIESTTRAEDGSREVEGALAKDKNRVQ